MIPNFSSMATMRFTFVVFREMYKQLLDGLDFATNIHVHLKMNYIHFGDPFTFDLSPK